MNFVFVGKPVSSFTFWDLIVITAADESQAKVFKLQIDDKLKKKELPEGVKYHVIPDPAGCKIGNGGSTLVALEELHQIYKDALLNYKILLIHAGGFSQRLPSASLLGKIFTALPLGSPIYQMIDLKLAMYIDFPSRMNPGVFVTCADDIELFDIDGDESHWSFEKPGFTAVAHPSSIEIGTGHGVFLFESGVHRPSKVSMRSCVEFLHKPTAEQMRNSGAVIENFNLETNDELVYTDSVFFMDSGTAMKLAGYYQQMKPLQSEIDAYGDFLQALGPRATINYTFNVNNVVKENDNLIKTRQEIFDLLKGTPLNVIVMNESRFYHLGTMREYIFHFCNDPVFACEIGQSFDVFNLHTGKKAVEPSTKVTKLCASNNRACVMHSSITDYSDFPNACVVEYCNFSAEADVQIGSSSIVSMCSVNGKQKIVIPSNTFLHTVSISQGKDTKYVTIVLGIHDDVKKKVTEKNIGKLQLLGKPLQEYFTDFDASNAKLMFPADVQEYTIWQAKLFAVSDDMDSALASALEMVNTVSKGQIFTSLDSFLSERISMSDIIRKKNVSAMLLYRYNLYESIQRDGK